MASNEPENLLQRCEKKAEKAIELALQKEEILSVYIIAMTGYPSEKFMSKKIRPAAKGILEKLENIRDNEEFLKKRFEVFLMIAALESYKYKIPANDLFEKFVQIHAKRKDLFTVSLMRYMHHQGLLESMPSELLSWGLNGPSVGECIHEKDLDGILASLSSRELPAEKKFSFDMGQETKKFPTSAPC